MIKGGQYRLTKAMSYDEYDQHGGYRPVEIAVGTVFTYLGDVPHLDWFQCLIEVDESGRNLTGVVRRVGYGLPNFCEPMSDV